MSLALEIFQALSECQTDTKLTTQVVIPISALIALIVFLIHVRTSKFRQFPDNFAVISCRILFGIFFISSIRLLLDQRETRPEFCYFHAITFQFLRTAFVWHWILSMATLYLVVVIKTPVSEFRAKSQWYYTILGSITLLFTILPAVYGKYGVQNGLCYITGSIYWSLCFGYSHMALGIVVFLRFAFPVIRALRKIKQDVLQDVMYQQVFQAAFLFVLYTFSFLFLINSTLLEIWDGALNSKYIASTMYPYCVSTLYRNSFSGIVVGLIHLISYSSVKKFIKKARKREETEQTETESNKTGFQRLMDRLKGNREETNDGYVSVVTPRPFESMGCTAVSIPPDSEQKRAHFQANRAYTTNLLLHAKDELEAGRHKESGQTESSYETAVEIESESDGRLLAARERWLEEYNFTDAL